MGVLNMELTTWSCVVIFYVLGYVATFVWVWKNTLTQGYVTMLELIQIVFVSFLSWIGIIIAIGFLVDWDAFFSKKIYHKKNKDEDY